MKKIYCILALITIFISACKKESTQFNQSEATFDRSLTYHLKNGGEVTVVINQQGEYIVGGDVILSKDQIAYLEYNKVDEGKTATPRSTFTGEYQKLWPGGVVYYVINDADNSSSIASAINHWEANTPIRFVQRTNQANYVDFSGQPFQGAGQSQLGMVGGRQQIMMVANAGFTTAVHEIGHAVGLMHEHTRADRDNFINVNYSNISSQWRSQYNTYDVEGRNGFQIGTFDFSSVMLYRSDAEEPRVGTNTAPQMTRMDGSTWNDNFFLSAGDIAGVKYLYSPSVYAKITRDYDDANSYSNPDDASHNYFNKVEFFSNASFTTKVFLQNPVRINYVYTHEDFGRTTEINENKTVVAPIGVSEVYLGESKEEWRLDYGNYVYRYQSSYGLKKGTGYKIHGQ